MASAACAAENIVVSPSLFAVADSSSNSSPVAPDMALTFAMPCSKSLNVFGRNRQRSAERGSERKQAGTLHDEPSEANYGYEGQEQVIVPADLVDPVDDAVLLPGEEDAVDHINALEYVERLLGLLVVPQLGPVLIHGGRVMGPGRVIGGIDNEQKHNARAVR